MGYAIGVRPPASVLKAGKVRRVRNKCAVTAAASLPVVVSASVMKMLQLKLKQLKAKSQRVGGANAIQDGLGMIAAPSSRKENFIQCLAVW